MPDLITDDQRDLVSEVREALAKATPAPWEHQQCDEGCCHWVSSPTIPEILRHGTLEDLDLIANASSWLAALCDQVERLRLADTYTPEGVDIVMNQLRDVRARAEKAEAAIERVRTLADWHETKADKARRFPGAEVAIMEKAARVHDDAARRLRAALDGE